MKILGIDTSSKFLCIGFYGGLKIYEFRLNLGRSHEVFLLPSVERILDTLHTQPKDIDYLAVGLGPGSFTGIRIGLATVKGLALSLNKKVIGICSLDIIAYNAKDIKNYQFICPVIDAKRDLIYMSLYRNFGNKLRRVMPYRLTSISGLIKIIPKKTIFLGDALRLYKQALMINKKEARFLDEDFYYPIATNIIKLAIERIEENRFDNIMRLQPIYLYPKECQIKS